MKKRELNKLSLFFFLSKIEDFFKSYYTKSSPHKEVKYNLLKSKNNLHLNFKIYEKSNCKEFQAHYVVF